jgi:hypothetical protein
VGERGSGGEGSGLRLWVIVTVSLTEPWDPPGPQAELEAFLKSMPPMSEYEWRVLELAGFMVKATELAQLTAHS